MNNALHSHPLNWRKLDSITDFHTFLLFPRSAWERNLDAQRTPRSFHFRWVGIL